MKSFEGFGLSETLTRSLSKIGFKTPTPIQEKAIPLALQGSDILGSAQTGTGKTAAFSIPLVESLLNNGRGTALVMTPTRELAKQVLDAIQELLGPKSPLKTAFLIGGEPMGKQFNQLRQRPRIVVGTPGRINDHLERGTLMLNNAGFLVLDETDRMLDMGFGVQIDRILKFLPAKRQTLMFSATLPKTIVQLSGKYLKDPKRVSIGATNAVAQNIKHSVIRLEQGQKYKELLSQLHERNGSVIIFVKTKRGTERMAKNLSRDDFKADALHGDLKQNKRSKVMNSFRNQKFRILVATDIAARGLDVPHIEHVVNYDLPQVAEDYIHRMGRTARAGAEGSALCFVSQQDGSKWRAIECLLDPSKKNAFPEKRRNTQEKGPRKNSDKKRFSKRPSSKNFGKSQESGKSYSHSKSQESGNNRGDGKNHSSGKSQSNGKSYSLGKNQESSNSRGDGKNHSSGKSQSNGKSYSSGKSHSDGKSQSDGKNHSHKKNSGKNYGKSNKPISGNFVARSKKKRVKGQVNRKAA
ncbi:MAG: DEAD/DEAH box helicase [Alphaproteobacteria bacterium]|nr:DEAD/DEAH box helicase [Alphaproteobacteria bacterium]